MVARFNETGRSQVLAKRMDDLSGVFRDPDQRAAERGRADWRIVEFIEKPDEPQTLDSDLMAVGRYVFFPPMYGPSWSALNLAHGAVFS
jgi:UTP--glucose-1-phosphate uridylyltransferase